jgi:hypothetical protein
MSFAEKIDILGMSFDNMWYRVWLNKPKDKFNIADRFSKLSA